MNKYVTTFYKNGKVRVWNVFKQVWQIMPLADVTHEVLATLSVRERERIRKRIA